MADVPVVKTHEAKLGVEIGDNGTPMLRACTEGVSFENSHMKAKFQLAADTGATMKDGTVEGKVLGCGVSLGRKTSVSVFGTEIGFSFW
ncbi:hypothetical protein AGOR_G00151780 [Albula goreensis]|uniref:Uncharacterized protein n=1 Tax=Albula goreensis TaxID=1534307 RepID=A0A8T3D2R6_9TELE|nr:hypothetical protein AGOR_G00151780 [Albula goreensis]